MLDLLQVKPTMLHIAVGLMNTELSFYKRCSFPQWAATLGSVLEYYQNYMITSTMNTVTKDSSEQCSVRIPYLTNCVITNLVVYWYSHKNGTVAQNCTYKFIQRELLCDFQTKTMNSRCLHKEDISILMYALLWHETDILPMYSFVWHCRNIVGDDRCTICWCIVDWCKGHFTTKYCTIMKAVWAMYVCAQMRLHLHFKTSKFLMYTLVWLDRTSLTMKYMWEMLMQLAVTLLWQNLWPEQIGWEEPGEGCCSSAAQIVTECKDLSPSPCTIPPKELVLYGLKVRVKLLHKCILGSCP